jgi:hypothetical protein
MVRRTLRCDLIGSGEAQERGIVAAPALAAVDQVKKKSAGAAVQSSGRIRPAARRRLAREDSRKEWLTRARELQRVVNAV